MTQETGEWLKKRSQSFDWVAEAYDLYRPSYPEALVEHVVIQSHFPNGGKILEAGSGTGKATLVFARRGYAIHCIERGENLLKVARRNLAAYPQVTFEQADFNAWNGPARTYDLFISAQAWHWMDVSTAYQKAAHVLKPEGAIALFWNKAIGADTPVAKEIQRVYEQAAPELAKDKVSYNKEEMDQLQSEIEGSGYFHNLDVWYYPWSRRYSTEDYLGLLNTFSDHQLLPGEKKKELFTGIARALENHGGSVDRPMVAVVFIAQKQ